MLFSNLYEKMIKKGTSNVEMEVDPDDCNTIYLYINGRHIIEEWYKSFTEQIN